MISQPMISPPCGRFAPSATGSAHPGTLLAGLLCWLDLRSQGGRAVLRIEDLDPQRCNPQKTSELIEQLEWFGLNDWDVLEIQSSQHQRHRQALQQLQDLGMIYPCRCSRKQVQAIGHVARDGGWVYPGTCRHRALCSEDGQLAPPPWRLRQDQQIALRDESGCDLSMNLPLEAGDPVLLRRDGGVAYQLASVVDDAAQGVTRVVRGRDLAFTSAGQYAMAQALNYRLPIYRHHLLLLEQRDKKFAKFHGAVGVPQLRQVYAPDQLCGFLAHALGLLERPEPCRPQDLLSVFTWQRVRESDLLLHWDGVQLTIPAEQRASNEH